MAANEPNIKKWFKEYAEVLQKLHIQSPEYIWSGDKTGCRQCQRRRGTWAKSMSLCTALWGRPRGNINSAKFRKCCWPCMPSFGHTQGTAGAGKLVCGMPHFIKLAATQRDILQKHQFHQYGIHLCNTLPKLANLTIPTSSSSTPIRVTCTTSPF